MSHSTHVHTCILINRRGLAILFVIISMLTSSIEHTAQTLSGPCRSPLYHPLDYSRQFPSLLSLHTILARERIKVARELWDASNESKCQTNNQHHTLTKSHFLYSKTSLKNSHTISSPHNHLTARAISNQVVDVGCSFPFWHFPIARISLAWFSLTFTSRPTFFLPLSFLNQPHILISSWGSISSFYLFRQLSRVFSSCVGQISSHLSSERWYLSSYDLFSSVRTFNSYFRVHSISSQRFEVSLILIPYNPLGSFLQQ